MILAGSPDKSSYNPAMPSNKQRPRPIRYVGAVLAILCIFPLAIILWPIPTHTESFTVTSDQFHRTYLLSVEYPSAAVVGEVFTFVAHLSAVNPEVAEVSDSMSAMQLNANALSFKPEGVISAAFPGSKSVTFTWQSLPQLAGDSSLTLFLARQSLSLDTGKLVEQPAWAKVFPLSVRAGFGAWKNPLLFFAGCGLVFGILLILISGIPPRRRRP
jgi:hypothetical protein